MTDNPKGPFYQLAVTDISEPFETYPLNGYLPPHHPETKKGLPECCERHLEIYIQTKKWYKEFPNCCTNHKLLKDKDWFNTEDYKDLPLTILKKISYTEYHINKKANTKDWYQEIKNYIDYTLKSLGGQGIGAGHYLNGVHHYVKHVRDKTFVFTEEKRQKISAYLEEFIEPKKGKENNTDLNLLLDIYNRWLAAFPFEISYFAKFKEKAEKNLPFFYAPEYNPYTCLTTVKVRTKKELIAFLFEATKLLIYKIDIKQLIEEGYILDYDQEIFDLEIKKNDLNTKEIFEKFDKGELQYRKAIKQWLDIQKRTFRLFKSEKIKVPQTIPPPIPKSTYSQKNKTNHFEALFRPDWYDKIILFLERKTFILKDETNDRYKWDDESEDDFVGFFWALIELQFPDEEPFLYEPLPSNRQYQKLVFEAFQITKWNAEKFVRKNRHNKHVQASIASYKDELANYLFPV